MAGGAHRFGQTSICGGGSIHWQCCTGAKPSVPPITGPPWTHMCTMAEPCIQVRGVVMTTSDLPHTDHASPPQLPDDAAYGRAGQQQVV